MIATPILSGIPCWIVSRKEHRRQLLLTDMIATDEPQGVLHRTSPRYAHDAKKTERIDATLLALVRNEEVDAMVMSMRDLERTWNSKFNYPWTFFNDKPFTEEFKRKTRAATKAKCNYGRSLSRKKRGEIC